MNNHKFWDAFVIVTSVLGLSLFGVMCVVTFLARASQDLHAL